jgi:ABC-2 type transport system permease protein
MFYASLILIPIERIQAHDKPILGVSLVHLWMLNPLADVMEQYRHALLGPTKVIVSGGVPTRGGISAAAAIGGYPELAIPVGFVVLLLVGGFWVFNRSAPHIAENL